MIRRSALPWLLVLALPAMSLAQATEGPGSRDTVRDPVVIVADEYVADSLKPTARELEQVRKGDIIPLMCRIKLPNIETDLGAQLHGPAIFDSLRLDRAVIGAIIKRNLIQLGLDPQIATSLADTYYRERTANLPTPAEVARGLSSNPKLANADYSELMHWWAQQPASLRQAIFEDAPAQSAADEKTLWTPEDQAVVVANPNAPEVRLLKAINRLASKPPDFPLITLPRSGCAFSSNLDHVTRFLLRLQPSGGSVFIVNRTSFRLCELRMANPYDRTKCTDWKDISGQSTRLLGNYMISAEWSDGRFNRGRREFEYDGANQRVIDLHPEPRP